MSARTILKHVYENGGMTEYQYERIDRVLKERERPHGEWKDTTHAVVCSNCGHNIEPRLFGDYMRYCCVCGSDNWKEGKRNE